eukprot:1100455-Rhodomonas_salina.1
MVRPQGSVYCKNLGLQFAQACTTQDQEWRMSLGRCGRYSVYDVFSTCFPECSRENNVKNGISNVELNKVLEQQGNFIRQRTKGRGIDCPANGSYRFGRRRWFDPDDDHERGLLAEAWTSCSALHPPKTSFEAFLQVLRDVKSHDENFYGSKLHKHRPRENGREEPGRSSPFSDADALDAASASSTTCTSPSSLWALYPARESSREQMQDWDPLGETKTASAHKNGSPTAFALTAPVTAPTHNNLLPAVQSVSDDFSPVPEFPASTVD